MKFNQLDSFSKQLALDFIELLLKRKAENGGVNYVADKQVEYKRLPPQSISRSDDKLLPEENPAYLNSFSPSLRPIILAHFKKLRAKQTPQEALEDPFGNKIFKENLAKVSTWSEEDIREIEAVTQRRYENWDAEPAKVPFDENYRKRLLELPSWTDQEIEEFDNARDKMQNWKIEEW